jgi:hypothetical protein
MRIFMRPRRRCQQCCRLEDACDLAMDRLIAIADHRGELFLRGLCLASRNLESTAERMKREQHTAMDALLKLWRCKS